jgi:hypothetical protein
MGVIKVVPDILIHRFLTGGAMTGVSPGGVSYSFDYDNEAGGPFTEGEGVSWTGGTGILSSLVDNGTTGEMVILLSTGVVPSDGLTITGAASSATADVDGAVSTVSYSDSEESVKVGRYRLYSGLTDGGLVEIPESTSGAGYRVKRVLVGVPGLTSVSFRVVDRGGYDVSAGAIYLESGYGSREWSEKGILVPPGGSFKAIGVGVVSSIGEIMFELCRGWASSVFDGGYIGASNLPPGKEVS